MGPVFPAFRDRLGLGVGLDLQWGATIGFEHDAQAGDRVAPRVGRFLDRHRDDFSYAFVSFQPKGRGRLQAADYYGVLDDLFEHMPPYRARALHHTLLNLGALERYDRSSILEATNQLIARYGLAWVNEDLGVWSMFGKPMPYPLPPFLNRAGLAAAIHNVQEVMAGLDAPLLMEFPGFSEGTNVCVGAMHAYDFFRRIHDETGVAVTLDTGHLLSYQWQRGLRDEALYQDLERLPLDACFEIHLSGCQWIDGRFVDVHHGILRDEQLVLLERLLERCPNVKALTYEDPKFDHDGVLRPKAQAGFDRLRHMAARWAA